MGAIEGQITEDLHPAIGRNSAQALPLLLQPPLLLFRLNRRGFIAVQLTQKRLDRRAAGSGHRHHGCCSKRARSTMKRAWSCNQLPAAGTSGGNPRCSARPGRQRILLIQQRRIEGKATGGAVGRTGAIGGGQRQHPPHPTRCRLNSCSHCCAPAQSSPPGKDVTCSSTPT